MDAHSCRRRTPRVIAGLTGALAVGLGAGVAAGHPAEQAAGPGGPPAPAAAIALTGRPPARDAAVAITGRAPTPAAVVAITGRTPVRVPGVRVTAFFPRVGAELVRGDAAALARLATARGVLGLSPDRTLHTTDASFTPGVAGPGVVAWQGLGPEAGTPGAGAGVTVALVDTGVSDTAALSRAGGRLVDGVDTSAVSTTGVARTSGEFTDGYGHGTFLASLIAGGPVPGSEGRGLGVAPGARVVAVKVADDSGTTSLADVLAGLDWVASHRPIDVAALALGADRPNAGYGADPLALAIQHLRQTGVTVVVAAGNTPGQVSDPGFDPRGITVGAADTTGAAPSVAPFSGSAVVAGVTKPDVVASGVNMVGELPPGSVLAQDYPSAEDANGLFHGSGTSQATAVAAGLAAIYLGDHPWLGPEGVKEALAQSATPVPGASGPGGTAGAGLVGAWSGLSFTGAAPFDATSYWANAWQVPNWPAELAGMWTTQTYTAQQWNTDPWSGDAWSADAWSAKSWSAKSWSAKSWSAKSWSAKSWSDYAWGATRTDAAP